MQSKREFRFWKCVKVGGENDCWPWLKTKTRGGYGTTNYEHERTTAHRIAFKLSGAPIPIGHYVLHRCDNPACCNPKHLFVGTQKANIDDMHKKGRGVVPRPIGEKHGMAKVMDAEVREIKTIRNTYGISQDQLAKMFGISQSQISRILRGENRTNATKA